MNSMSITMAPAYHNLSSTASIAVTKHKLNHLVYFRRCNEVTPSSSPRQFRCLTSGHVSRTFVTRLQAFPLAATETLFQDGGATVVVLSGAYALVTAFDNLATHGVIPQSLSRKLVHILSGLLFMASWPLFSTSTEARYFASIVPLTNCLRLMIHGLSLAENEALINSLTRDGKPEELLRGPLYYVMILTLCAVIFWRESPVGVISLSMMCGGDGVADIMGRKFGNVKIPYNQDKSWAGSISMFAVGFLISIGMLYYFSAFGYFKLDWVLAMKRVALVSFVATTIESLPITKFIDDNISVPVATMVTAYLCFCF